MSSDLENSASAILACLESRRRRCGPTGPTTVNAITLATLCSIAPHASHEARRRQVRSIIKHLRDNGHDILTEGSGYYLAVDPGDYTRAEKYRKTTGLRHLVAVSNLQHSEERTDAGGQMGLFPNFS